MDEPDGILQYLIYLIVGLCTFIFGVISKHMTGRIERVENKASSNEDNIQSINVAIEKKFNSHEKEERDRDDEHRKEVAGEFKELRKDMNTGHTAILREVNSLARQMKNGRS